jgi:hypothetical protein
MTAPAPRVRPGRRSPAASTPPGLARLASPRRLARLGRLASPWHWAGLWHLTSLDAPTVAVVWTLGFAWAAHATLPVWVPALLALAAWAVYIGDRLLDARSSLLNARSSLPDAHAGLRSAHRRRLRLRHRFHWRHRRVFLPIAVAAACAAAVLVFAYMPLAARERNSLLAAAALAYFTRVHAGQDRAPSALRTPFLIPLVSKEMLVGLLFTAACALPVLSRAGQSPAMQGPLLAAAIFFALLAWLNCHAIEHWESERRVEGVSATFIAALALALGGVLAAAMLASAHPRAAALLVSGSASALLLALLDRRRHRLTPLALRAAADLALLTPALLTPALLKAALLTPATLLFPTLLFPTLLFR